MKRTAVGLWVGAGTLFTLGLISYADAPLANTIIDVNTWVVPPLATAAGLYVYASGKRRLNDYDTWYSRQDVRDLVHSHNQALAEELGLEAKHRPHPSVHPWLTPTSAGLLVRF